MVKVTINRRHRIPHVYDFTSLQNGAVFIKKDTDSNRLLIKQDKDHYSDICSTTLFTACLPLFCYIVEELEIQYSLRYE